jgi:hypothetical protein
MNSTLSITSNCIDCNLCLLLCRCTNVHQLENDIIAKCEPVVFVDTAKLAILLQKAHPQATIIHKLGVPGNYREKKIDLVLFKNTHLYLIKVLQNTTKYNYYVRSYSEVMPYIHSTYPNFTPMIIVLVPDNVEIDRIHNMSNSNVKTLKLNNILVL